MADLEQSVEFIFSDSELGKLANKVTEKISSGATKTIGEKPIIREEPIVPETKSVGGKDTSAIGLLGSIAIGIGVIAAFWESIGPIVTTVMKLLSALILITLIPFLKVGLAIFRDSIPTLLSTAELIASGITGVIEAVEKVVTAFTEFVVEGLKGIFGEEKAKGIIEFGTIFTDEIIPKLLAGGFIVIASLMLGSLLFKGAASLSGFLALFGFSPFVGVAAIAAIAVGLVITSLIIDRKAAEDERQERIWKYLLGEQALLDIKYKFSPLEEGAPGLEPPILTTPEGLVKREGVPTPTTPLGRFATHLFTDPLGLIIESFENIATSAQEGVESFEAGWILPLEGEKPRILDEAFDKLIAGTQDSSENLGGFADKVTITSQATITSLEDFKKATDEATSGSGLVSFKIAVDDGTSSLAHWKIIMVESINAIGNAVRQAQIAANNASISAAQSASVMQSTRKNQTYGGMSYS